MRLDKVHPDPGTVKSDSFTHIRAYALPPVDSRLSNFTPSSPVHSSISPRTQTLRKPSRLPAERSPRNLITDTLDRIKSIPWTSIWMVALVVGGLLTVVFCASNRFLPDVDLKDIGGILACIAIVGLFFVGAMGMGLMLPTLMIDGQKTERPLMRLVDPFAGIFLAACGLVSLEGAPDRAFIVCTGVGAFLLFCIANWMPQSTLDEWLKRALTMLMRIAGWAIWALLVPMLYLLSLDRGEHLSIPQGYLLLLLVPAAFAMMSFAVASRPKEHRAFWIGGACALAVLMLGLIAQRPAFIAQATFEALGLSIATRPVTFILTPSGCHAANLALISKPCVLDAESELGSLSNGHLISRLGGQVVLHWRQEAATLKSASGAATQIPKSKWQRIVLRKDDVRSWSYEVGP